MRLLPTLGAFLVCLGLTTIRAQEPTLPKPESQDPQPDTSPTPGTVAVPTAPPLIPALPTPPGGSSSPPPVPNLPTIPQLDEVFDKRPLSPSAENAKYHLEWRELRNRVAADPRVTQALAAAEAAQTDLEKRRLLRQYYELYYGRMVAVASTPGLKAFVKARKNERLSELPQPRVRPTSTPTPVPKR